MNAMRGMASFGIVVSLATLIAMWLSVESRAQTADKTSIVGAWTLNKDLSDQPMGRSDDRSAGVSLDRKIRECVPGWLTIAPWAFPRGG